MTSPEPSAVTRHSPEPKPGPVRVSDATPFAGLAALEPLIDQCVHCGFCLPTCPSYLLLNQEMDSPRGRIYLMKAGAEERVSMTPALVEHFDTCLGCMACETACPSGVRYAPLIEETRATIEEHHQRTLADRLFRSVLFHLLPHAGRLRILAAPIGAARLLRRLPRVVSWLPERIRNLVALAPDVKASDTWLKLRERTPPVGAQRLRVGLLAGCVQQVFFAQVNAATARVLAAEGCEVIAPRRQGCCGASHCTPAETTTPARPRALIGIFEDRQLQHIVVSAAGCRSTMKMYGSC
jgi:glycolate oxidase iron-sulfur subunit